MVVSFLWLDGSFLSFQPTFLSLSYVLFFGADGMLPGNWPVSGWLAGYGGAHDSGEEQRLAHFAPCGPCGGIWVVEKVRGDGGIDPLQHTTPRRSPPSFGTGLGMEWEKSGSWGVVAVLFEAESCFWGPPFRQRTTHEHGHQRAHVNKRNKLVNSG